MATRPGASGRTQLTLKGDANTTKDAIPYLVRDVGLVTAGVPWEARSPMTCIPPDTNLTNRYLESVLAVNVLDDVDNSSTLSLYFGSSSVGPNSENERRPTAGSDSWTNRSMALGVGASARWPAA